MTQKRYNKFTARRKGIRTIGKASSSFLQQLGVFNITKNISMITAYHLVSRLKAYVKRKTQMIEKQKNKFITMVKDKLHSWISTNNSKDIQITSMMLNLVKANEHKMPREVFHQLTSCLITKRYNTYIDEIRNIHTLGFRTIWRIQNFKKFVMNAKRRNFPPMTFNDHDVEPCNRECYRLLAQNRLTKFNITTDPLLWIINQYNSQPARSPRVPTNIFLDPMNIHPANNNGCLNCRHTCGHNIRRRDSIPLHRARLSQHNANQNANTNDRNFSDNSHSMQNNN